MFSNGKFKNVVADVNESYQIKAGESYRKEYKLLPLKGKEKLIQSHKWLRKMIRTQSTPTLIYTEYDINANYTITCDYGWADTRHIIGFCYDLFLIKSFNLIFLHRANEKLDCGRRIA